MDRINEDVSGIRPSSPMIWGLFLLLVSAILAYKAVDEGWFKPRSSLALNGEPALIFFNRHKGCQCAMPVYFAAKYQVQAWSEEDRQGMPLFMVDLDTQPELGKEFDVIRAPTLLLVDGSGKTILKQDEVVTDAQPLDPQAFETKIGEVLYGK